MVLVKTHHIDSTIRQGYSTKSRNSGGKYFLNRVPLHCLISSRILLNNTANIPILPISSRITILPGCRDVVASLPQVEFTHWKIWIGWKCFGFGWRCLGWWGWWRWSTWWSESTCCRLARQPCFWTIAVRVRVESLGRPGDVIITVSSDIEGSWMMEAQNFWML